MASDNAIRWNERAQQCVLGAVLLDNAAFDAAALEPEDFYGLGYQEHWRAMRALRDARKPIDPVTVVDAMGPQSKATGGLTALSKCLSATPTADNIESYAEIVRRDARTRRVHQELSRVLGSSAEGEELEALAWQALSRVGDGRGDRFITMADLAAAEFRAIGDMVDALARGEQVQVGVPTGYRDLDDALSGGLGRGVVTILGGRPSSGKSALARGIADRASALGVGVHVLSLEDKQSPYAQRALADHARVNLHSLRLLRLKREHMAALAQAAETLQRRTWGLDDSSGLSAAQIAMRVRRRKKELGTQLVIVDYVQLMKEPGAKDHRAEVEAAIRGLQELASAEDVAVLALSQLTRTNVKEERPPALHDLRESGELEQVAAAVLFTHVVQEKGRDTGQVIIAKNKHGERNTIVPLEWDGSTASYRERKTSADNREHWAQ